MVDCPKQYGLYNTQTPRSIMDKSHHNLAERPNWYRHLITRTGGDYFGSLSSLLYPEEVFVTHDGNWIVTRTADGEISVVQNVCLHAGMQILNHTGTQQSKEIRCSGHQWLYDRRGKLLACPKFVKSERSLARPDFSLWNGFVLGYSEKELSALSGFGETLGLPNGFLSANDFWYGEEEHAYKLPYPRPLMKINYDDGLHVAKYHEFSFGPMIDENDYKWEFGPSDTNVSYSIQLVNIRPNVRLHVDRLIHSRNKKIEDLGWANLHFWLEEKMPKAETPIDKNIFAVWASIYGNGYIMPELYFGGRFLALSYLVSAVGGDGISRNMNYVEFYIHKSIPESLRRAALEKFIYAYEQSAREDDEICTKLWSAHRRDDIDFNRITHGELEAGEVHFRDWFLRHFAL